MANVDSGRKSKKDKKMKRRQRIYRFRRPIGST